MHVETIGLDLAKNVFRSMASMAMVELSSAGACDAPKCFRSLARYVPAALVWRHAARPITGLGN
jgi:hypothetical protein